MRFAVGWAPARPALSRLSQPLEPRVSHVGTLDRLCARVPGPRCRSSAASRPKCDSSKCGLRPAPSGHAAFQAQQEAGGNLRQPWRFDPLGRGDAQGLYFFTIQRPRLTWSVTYPGRTPVAQPPSTVVLVFRTQEPQVALDSRLVIAVAGEQRLEVASTGAYSVQGVQTWSHFMRFPVPTTALAAALATEEVAVSVGGIRVGVKPDQVNALRDLLSRVRAWPTDPVHGGA
jgi:hypothetical protein